MSTDNGETRSKRESKKVERYEVEVSEKKELEVGGGNGTALGEIPVILYYINIMNGDHDLLKAVHKIMYGGTGTSSMRKRQIRAFNGFPKDSDSNKIIQTMTNSKSWKPTKCCKEFCQFLDVDHVGDKDVLIQRAVEFLMKPTAMNSTELNNEGVPLWRMQKVKKKVKRSRSDDSDDESSPEPKAKKSKKTKKIAKKKKKDKKKKKSASPIATTTAAAKVGTPAKSGKPKSAKFLYLFDRKDAAKVEHPEIGGVELAQMLIKEFNNLDGTQKAQYEKRAADELAAWEEAAAMAAEFDDL